VVVVGVCVWLFLLGGLDTVTGKKDGDSSTLVAQQVANGAILKLSDRGGQAEIAFFALGFGWLLHHLCCAPPLAAFRARVYSSKTERGGGCYMRNEAEPVEASGLANDG